MFLGAPFQEKAIKLGIILSDEEIVLKSAGSNLMSSILSLQISTNNLSRGLKIPTDKLDYHIPNY